MRKLLIGIAFVGGLASVALCAGYGWDQATALKDQVTAAFIYGMVAVFTLVLHVVAIRAWVMGWRKSGSAIGVAAFLAFVMTAFTSLGGLASRADRVVAERQDVIDTRADTKKQIDDLVAERKGLKFTRTTQATVDAAKAVSHAATKAREQECGKVGDNCRKRQDAEGAALTALTKAQENKAATDRFAEIEAELKRLRSQKSEGGVGTVNPLRDLLATIMGAWADLLTAWQKAVFAVIYDVCLIAAMAGIEVLGHGAPHVARRKDVPAEPEPINVTLEPTNSVAILPAPTPRKRIGRTEPQAEIDPKPVVAFMARRVPVARGAEADWGDIYAGFLEDWETQGLPGEPLTGAQFGQALRYICEQAGIRIERRGKRVVCVDRQLVA